MDNALLHENRSNETRSVGMLEKSWKFFFFASFRSTIITRMVHAFWQSFIQGTKIRIEKEKFTTIFVFRIFSFWLDIKDINLA